MNSCWPYGGSAQQMNLNPLDRPLYDSRTLAMLARQYQPSIMSALLSLSTNQNTTDDNNNTSQRLSSTTNELNDEQQNENNSNPNSGSAKKLWRPLDIMR